jgi:hypothetical protein
VTVAVENEWALLYPFTQQVWPLAHAFGGRLVSERAATGVDTCYFVGSQFDEAISLSESEPWTVESDNTWGPDAVGWGLNEIDYDRQERATNNLPMPCASHVVQVMKMETCDWTAPKAYHKVSNVATIGTTTVASRRGPVLRSTVLPPPQP